MVNHYRTPVNDYLHDDVRWKMASGEQKAAFRVAMRGRGYGLEPTLDAWHWFCTGWAARMSQP